jgi:hypothetical protein
MEHVIKGFVTYRAAHEWEDKPKIDFYTYDPRLYRSTSESIAVVKEHSFTVDVPDDFDPRPQQVAALDAKIEQTRAEFTKRLNELQEQKNKLLCLEMAP